MNSIPLVERRATLLSRATICWVRIRTSVVSAIAPLAAAPQGGAMAFAAVAPVTSRMATTDHYPTRLGPPPCRPPV